jgi:hypothetical protein
MLVPYTKLSELSQGELQMLKESVPTMNLSDTTVQFAGKILLTKEIRMQLQSWQNPSRKILLG